MSSPKCPDCGWSEGHASGCSFAPHSVEADDAAGILRKAASLVSGDRAKQHGGKLENHANIAALWGAYLGVRILPEQVALMMVLLKVARTKSGSKNLDDYVDMAGYSGIAGELADI